jgi:hypothetical protein
MSVNFYNTSGAMIVGTDLHEYFFVGGKNPYHPHMVTMPFFWPLNFSPKKITSVTSNGGWASLQGGMDYYIVPHIPMPFPPPHPVEAGVLALTIAGSGTKAWMTVHKVEVGGDKAATCLLSCMSTNQNCCDPIDLHINNVVLNLNSVKTQPTPGDYIGSFLSTCLDAVISFGVGGAMDKAVKGPKKMMNKLNVMLRKQVWRRAPDIKNKVSDNEAVDWVVDAPGQVSEMIQKWVDGE